MGRLYVPTRVAVKLEILDLSGRRAASFLEPVREMESHPIIWETFGVSSGIYLHKLTTAAFPLIRRMILWGSGDEKLQEQWQQESLRQIQPATATPWMTPCHS